MTANSNKPVGSTNPRAMSDAELCFAVAGEVLRCLPEVADYVHDPVANERVRNQMRRLRYPSLGTARTICEEAVLVARGAARRARAATLARGDY